MKTAKENKSFDANGLLLEAIDETYSNLVKFIREDMEHQMSLTRFPERELKSDEEIQTLARDAVKKGLVELFTNEARVEASYKMSILRMGSEAQRRWQRFTHNVVMD